MTSSAVSYCDFDGVPVDIDSADLAQLRWEKRVLLWREETVLTNDFLPWLEEKSQEGLEERRLLLARAKRQGGLHGLFMPNRKGEEHAHVLLIGLDGGVKWKGYKTPDVEMIFAIIDAMPMRRSEMEKNTNTP